MCTLNYLHIKAGEHLYFFLILLPQTFVWSDVLRSFINKITVRENCRGKKALSVVLCSSFNEKNVHLSTETADVAASGPRSPLFTSLQHLSAFVTSTLAGGPASLYSEHTDWSNCTLTAEKTIQVEAFLDGSARFQTSDLGIPAALQSNMHFKPATNLIKGLCNHIFPYHITQLYQAQWAKPEPRMSENVADPCLPGTSLFLCGGRCQVLSRHYLSQG